MNKQKQFEWRKAEDWSYVREVEAPKLGRNEEFLKLYEEYASMFTRTEDQQYVYLEFQGDVKDKIDLVQSFHSSIFESEMFTEGKDYITAIHIQIKLVMEKFDHSDKKLVPSEAKIILTTSLENKEEKWTAKSEDHFEYYYRNLNNVEEIKKPEGVTLK